MVEIKKYDNGLTLIVEKMNNYESVAFKVFVKVGSVNETEGNYGISHFIEHMMFKGTKTRSALEIANSLESVGVKFNAYTDKTETCYYTKSAGEHIERCVEVLSDMFFNSIFDKKEMAKEKKVVCEELAMYNDKPSYKCSKLANELFYNGTDYARDVGGTKQSVKNLTQEKIFEYLSKYYVAQNTIISFAGNITLNKAEKLVEKYFVNNFKNEGVDSTISNQVPKIVKRTAKSFKDNEQAQVCISFPAFKQDDDRRFALRIFCNAFGGGMSSKLFQRIREKLGLVYTINMYSSTNAFGGDSTIYFATTNKNVSTALKAIKEEIDKVIENGLTETEFNNSKSSFISNTKMGYEGTSTVASSNVRQYASLGKVYSKKELVDILTKITKQDVDNVIKYVFNFDKFVITYVGKNSKIDLLKHFN